jgi:hypothetical protein
MSRTATLLSIAVLLCLLASAKHQAYGHTDNEEPTGIKPRELTEEGMVRSRITEAARVIDA